MKNPKHTPKSKILLKPQEITFDSIRQAAAKMNLSTDFLKRAKALGADGFHGNRVQRIPLEKWLATNADELTAGLSGDSLKDQKLSEEIRKLKRVNDEAAGDLVRRADVAAAFSRGASQLKSFRIELETMLPSRIAGLTDVASARLECRRIADRIYEVFGGMAAEFEPLDKSPS